jgi:hypothetical protein
MKLLLLETVVFAVAAILYGFLFYDTYCDFYAEVLTMVTPGKAEPVKLVQSEGDTSA